jgi:F-type H+-transporting ATPase subunit epsilon
MDEKFIELKILSKNGIKFNGSVTLITVPSITGEITLLPNHIPLLSGLKSGIIKFGQKSSEKISIVSGFVRFINNTCIVTIEEDVVKKAS